MNKVFDRIYKADTKSKIRVWYMEQEGEKYRSWDGTLGGKVKCSEWTIVEGTNIGRSNERSPVEQATFIINSKYKKKLEKDYHDNLDNISQGSHIIQPMLAKDYEYFEPGIVQPKLDGLRCIATKDGLFSRNGKPIVSCPHIIEELKAFFEENPDDILDGELYNHEAKDNFNKLVSMIRRDEVEDPILQEEISQFIQYHIYDTFTPNSQLDFMVRFANITGKLLETNSIKFVDTQIVVLQEEYDDFHACCIEQGYEGSIHRLNKPYENKRSSYLKKRKDFIDKEYPIHAIEEGKGNWSGAAKRIICLLENGKKFGASVAGSYEDGVKLLNENPKPTIATISFPSYTPSGKPRFGVATKFHYGKREY